MSSVNPNFEPAKFVLSKEIILDQYNLIKNHADIISYSSKTNPDVTKVLERNSNAMFSIHFENELKHLKDLSRVLFLAQGWTVDYIDHLVKRGISFFTVDNVNDLNTFVTYLNSDKSNNNKLDLLLRLKVRENSIRTERYFVFGMNSEIINKRIQELRTHPKIGKLGIHFHRKTQNVSEWSIKFELTRILEKDTLNNINFLNIGGGLPSEYANTNMNVLKSIFNKIDDLRNWLKEEHKCKLIIEPGRFIAAPAGKLVTKIIGIHDNNIIVNSSVYNSDMDAILVPVKLLVQGELKKTDKDAKPYVIKGITPCSMDLFRYRVYLKNPQVGDDLIFLNAGAYNFASDFCDLEKNKTIIE